MRNCILWAQRSLFFLSDAADICSGVKVSAHFKQSARWLVPHLGICLGSSHLFIFLHFELFPSLFVCTNENNAFEGRLFFWTNNECISPLSGTAGFLLDSDFGCSYKRFCLQMWGHDMLHKLVHFQHTLYSNNICWESVAILWVHRLYSHQIFWHVIAGEARKVTH